MADYEVWTSNDPSEWTICHLETDDREQAKAFAQELVESATFKFVVIDHHGKAMWSNDPDTPVETD